jgi:hypothetical protein
MNAPENQVLTSWSVGEQAVHWVSPLPAKTWMNSSVLSA